MAALDPQVVDFVKALARAAAARDIARLKNREDCPKGQNPTKIGECHADGDLRPLLKQAAK